MRNLLLGFLLGLAATTYAWDSDGRSVGGDLLEQNRLGWRYGAPSDPDEIRQYQEYRSRRSPCGD